MENQEQIINVDNAKKQNLFKISIVILLALNILLSIVILITNMFGSSDIRSPQAVIAENKAVADYRQQLGKDNFKIVDETVTTSVSGTKSIKGSIQNTGSKSFNSVTVAYKLYHNGICVDSASDYIYFPEPGQVREFEASAYGTDFDEYELYYISASED